MSQDSAPTTPAQELGTLHGREAAEAWLMRFSRGGFEDNFLGESRREQLRLHVEAGALTILGIPEPDLTGEHAATYDIVLPALGTYEHAFRDAVRQTVRRAAEPLSEEACRDCGAVGLMTCIEISEFREQHRCECGHVMTWIGGRRIS